VEDAFQGGPAVDGRVVLGEHGDDLLLRVEAAADVLQVRLLSRVDGHAAGLDLLDDVHGADKDPDAVVALGLGVNAGSIFCKYLFPSKKL
jgi:hypothetical protein